MVSPLICSFVHFRWFLLFFRWFYFSDDFQMLSKNRNGFRWFSDSDDFQMEKDMPNFGATKKFKKHFFHQKKPCPVLGVPGKIKQIGPILLSSYLLGHIFFHLKIIWIWKSSETKYVSKTIWKPRETIWNGNMSFREYLKIIWKVKPSENHLKSKTIWNISESEIKSVLVQDGCPAELLPGFNPFYRLYLGQF